jgi:hypothetical protein
MDNSSSDNLGIIEVMNIEPSGEYQVILGARILGTASNL